MHDCVHNPKLSLKVTERVYLCTISIDSHLPRSLMVIAPELTTAPTEGGKGRQRYQKEERWGDHHAKKR
jgi:hypothetical protein